MSRRRLGRGCCWGVTAVVVLVVAVSVPGRLVAGPSAADYVRQAVTLFNRGDCARAVELLKKALELDPRYVPAYSWLGTCYARLGKRAEAISAFQKVVELAPNTEHARVARQWMESLQRQQAQGAGPTPTPTPVPSATVTPAPTPSPTAVYLVDLPAVAGVTDANRAERVQLFGVVYRKALVERRDWSEREWRVVYNLQRRWGHLRVLAGVADGEKPDFRATFTVRGDGRVLHESQPKRVGDVPEDLVLDVRGVLQLELVVRGEQRSWVPVTVVWADPRLFAPGVALPARPPAAQPAAPAPPTVQPATPTPPAPSPAAERPPATGSPSPQGTPAAGPTLRGVAVLPFQDNSGRGRDAGPEVAAAVTAELFKLPAVETVSPGRLLQAVGPGPLDVLSVARRAGARVAVLGIVERFEVQTRAVELGVRLFYRDAFVTVVYVVVDVETGERLLTDTARVGLRATAASLGGLPADERILREAVRQVAAEIAQKVGLVWAQRVGLLTIQFTQVVLGRNVVRGADFRLQPVGVSTSFPSSSLQIVAYAAGTGGKANQKIEFVWFDPQGREYARGTVELPADQSPDEPFVVHHVIRPPAGGSLAPGAWRVEVRVGGLVLRRLSFTVTEG